MPPTETTPHATLEGLGSRLVGGAALVLVFFGGAILAWAYLALSSASTQVASAVAADPPSPDYFAGIALKAHAALVYDMKTGRTLYALHPDAQLPLASLAKVPLVLVVAEALSPYTVITIPYDTSPPGSYARLGKGQRWPLQDIIDFTLAISSNKGADILAEAADESVHLRYPASPSGGATLWRMNDLARQLGLAHTYFLNDNGLDESVTQSGAYGSARDVAGLFAYAASKEPQIFSATTESSFTLRSPYGAVAQAVNTDEALPSISGIIMGKTGYTDLAGGNLAVVFDAAPGHPMVAVVLGSTYQGRFEDMKALVAAAEKTAGKRTPLPE